MAGICEIVHSSPGRVRLRIPALYNSEAPVEQIGDWIRQRDGVSDVRMNSSCACAIVYYDAQQASVPDNILNGLATLNFESLRSLTSNATRKIGESVHDGSEAGWLSYLEPSGWPALALATGALAVSIAGAPFLAPIGFGLSAYCALPSFHRAFTAVHDEHRLNVDVLDSLAIAVATAQGSLF